MFNIVTKFTPSLPTLITGHYGWIISHAVYLPMVLRHYFSFLIINYLIKKTLTIVEKIWRHFDLVDSLTRRQIAK